MMPEKILAAGGVVTNENNELLMIFRRGKWDLPKGKSDKGETVESCAIREVKEETGIKKLELGKLVGITYHEYFDKYRQENVIKETHWFSMHASAGAELVPQTDEDIEEIIWADNPTVKKCLENTYPNIAEIIGQFQKGYLQINPDQ